jgi:DNA-directed RNA polymerase specialized sigma24 family protein
MLPNKPRGTLRTQHISNVRQYRRTVAIDDLTGDADNLRRPVTAVEGREVWAAMMQVSSRHRELLIMVAAIGLVR